MMQNAINLFALILFVLWIAIPAMSAPIPIENASFEAPVVDPNGFGAVPLVEGWVEIDIDTLASTNTGVFANTEPNSFDHIVNADGNQLAFLGSQTGNALQQDLDAVYKAGCEYTLTVGVSISSRFPPSAVEPVDTLELVFYYHDANDVIDIAHQAVEAIGLSYTELQDFSLVLPIVTTNDAWVGMNIGVALRAEGQAGGFWDLDNVRLIESAPVSIPVENASFEAPVVDPCGFGAVPLVEGWMEIDIDTITSTNTGVFANTEPNSFDHIVNADGSQLVFLGSQTGNALEQDLDAVYITGCDYRLIAGVSVSSRFPPSAVEPVDTLELVFYYQDGNDVVDIASQTIDATGQSYTQLKDFSLELPTVQASDAWAGMNIGIALRAVGQPGGFWDLDNIRLIESLPVSVKIENASFEFPIVDPNAFPALPYIDGWTESDNDTLASANTGVFANTSEDSWDHKDNADGRQLAFMGSEYGNALSQELDDTYKVGCSYRMAVAVGVSSRYVPSIEDPVDLLELVFSYRDGDEVLDIMSRMVDATGLSQKNSTDIFVYLPTVQPDDTWADMTISIALRSVGLPGGFWALDNVRLARSTADQNTVIQATE
jgi:hypothetical protein